MLENELKFLLSPTFVPEDLDTSWKLSEILQVYTLKARYRAETQDSSTTYTRCVKVEQDGMWFEEETPCTKDEFFTQFYKWEIPRLAKARFTSKRKDDLWCVDFFHQNWNIYAVMAEVEMPADKQAPSYIPIEIKDSIIYAVPRAELKQFSSLLFADYGYATRKIKEIFNGKKE